MQWPIDMPCLRASVSFIYWPQNDKFYESKKTKKLSWEKKFVWNGRQDTVGGILLTISHKFLSSVVLLSLSRIFKLDASSCTGGKLNSLKLGCQEHSTRGLKGEVREGMRGAYLQSSVHFQQRHFGLHVKQKRKVAVKLPGLQQKKGLTTH